MEKLYKNKEWLNDQYWNKKQSENMIAKKCGIVRSTLQYWFKKFGILHRRKNELNQAYSHMGFQKGNKLSLNERNVNWKGKDAKIKALHYYVGRRKNKPEECPHCNEKKEVELSFNHDLGNYTRDHDDYIYICHKCHFKRDKEVFRLHEDFSNASL